MGIHILTGTHPHKYLVDWHFIIWCTMLVLEVKLILMTLCKQPEVDWINPHTTWWMTPEQFIYSPPFLQGGICRIPRQSLIQSMTRLAELQRLCCIKYLQTWNPDLDSEYMINLLVRRQPNLPVFHLHSLHTDQQSVQRSVIRWAVWHVAVWLLPKIEQRFTQLTWTVKGLCELLLSLISLSSLNFTFI